MPQASTIATMSNPLKPILAGLDGTLARIERQAQARSSLLIKVQAALPAPENEHVVSAAYEKGALILAADSAAWCARLRYCQEALQTGLADRGETPFTKLRVRVGRLPNTGKTDKEAQ